MNVLRHWREADALPRCQHCPALADERSFMCEDHAGEAGEEVQTLRDQLAGAVGLLEQAVSLIAQPKIPEHARKRWQAAVDELLGDGTAWGSR